MMTSIFSRRPILGITTLFVLFLCGTYHAAAQSVECPVDKVCISREAALKALADADENVAIKAENKVLKQSVEDFRELLNKMRIEFATVSGELTAVKQNAVSDRAIIDLLLKNTKKKCMPFSVCF